MFPRLGVCPDVCPVPTGLLVGQAALAVCQARHAGRRPAGLSHDGHRPACCPCGQSIYMPT